MKINEQAVERDCRIGVVVSADELERVRAAAEADDRSLSSFSRRVLLRHVDRIEADRQQAR